MRGGARSLTFLPHALSRFDEAALSHVITALPSTAARRRLLSLVAASVTSITTRSMQGAARCGALGGGNASAGVAGASASRPARIAAPCALLPPLARRPGGLAAILSRAGCVGPRGFAVVAAAAKEGGGGGGKKGKKKDDGKLMAERRRGAAL